MDYIYTNIECVTEGIDFFKDALEKINSLLLSLGFSEGDTAVLASNDVGEVTLTSDKLFMVFEVSDSKLTLTGYTVEGDLNTDLGSSATSDTIEETLTNCISSISMYSKPIRAVFFPVTIKDSYKVYCYELFTGEYDIYIKV